MLKLYLNSMGKGTFESSTELKDITGGRCSRDLGQLILYLELFVLKAFKNLKADHCKVRVQEQYCRQISRYTEVW